MDIMAALKANNCASEILPLFYPAKPILQLSACIFPLVLSLLLIFTPQNSLPIFSLANGL
ncbi:hypothetical protein C7N43_01145 [Sphingobacteriales bacterium UPWRP_1]|nr:hypothetical protein B6N25_14530 [Sphingobacteriales bacterium TSM_CSS]PSJ78917.1 hypothetical protein C7N43_01145 [Sphingobacteriales bacterium UPWRP_1]